jgi:hypothetical protein
MATEDGKVEYTGRAFRDDSKLAMSGDPIKALIELITNADDAYERRNSHTNSSGAEKSLITVTYSKAKNENAFLSVTDLAEGLDRESMKKCFGFLGAEQSGFKEGQKVRGLLGRGAKDTAVFGKTVFESIHNDLYHKFELNPDLEYTLDGDLPATKSIRHNLGIENGTNGMRAKIIFDDASDLGEFKKLRDRLSRTVQLREITTNREVILKRADDLKSAAAERIVWNPPHMEQILETKIRLDDYPEAEAQLTLYKLSQLQPGQVNQESLHGIEIRSGKIIFSNDNFGDSSIEMGWIHGVLQCEHIATLIRDFDNPTQKQVGKQVRLVRRDRDGLDKNHNFYKALQQKIAQILAPIIEELRPKSDKIGGSENLRKDLDRAGRQLAALLQADLARLDEDDIGRGPRPTVSSPLIVIPPVVLVVVAKRQTLTVLLASSIFDPELKLEAVSSNPTMVSINTRNQEFRSHALMPDTKVSTIVIEGLELGSSETTIQYGEYSCSCAITVINESIKIDEPPTFLEWDSEQSTCTINKRRSLRLRAPLDMIANEPFVVSVMCDNSEIEIDTPKLILDVVGDAWLEARAVIVGRQLDIKAELVASSNQGKAVTLVRITEPKAKLGTNLQINIHDSSAGNLRGRLSQTGDGLNILIFGQHSAIRPLLGKKLADGSFESEKDPAARVMIAEAVTTVIVEWLITKDSNKNPQSYSDASSVLAERNKLVARYLPVAREVLQAKESDQM